jgi:amidase
MDGPSEQPAHRTVSRHHSNAVGSGSLPFQDIPLILAAAPRAKWAAPRTAAAAAFDVTEKSIGELQAAMTVGQVSSVDLVHAYLKRIAAYDQQGPALNAVLYLNPNAVQLATELDNERVGGRTRGPLHGIPVLLKDNFDTSDMPTTGASVVLRGAQPAYDAFQVRKLRESGAVLLGKLNLHELALGLTTHSSLAGQTLNPYDLTRAPGGSSGGSGVAVAANFAAFAMGTDTAGSIRVPSSHNSIVGLRPTAGLSSRTGIIPFGHTQDTGGPMTRTVSDIALVLDATVGYDPVDESTVVGQGKNPATYTASLKADALKGARIGALNQLFGDAPEDREVGDAVRGALQEMRSQGVTVVDVAIPDLPSNSQPPVSWPRSSSSTWATISKRSLGALSAPSMNGSTQACCRARSKRSSDSSSRSGLSPRIT